MAYEGWLHFNGTEIANAGRTVELARVLGIDSVRLRRSSVHWIEASFDGTGFGLGEFGVGPFGIGDGDDINYRDISEAPWYDETYEASTEFAGFLPLSVRGLEGSTLTAGTTEFITDGGHSGVSRNSTLSLVTDGMIVASSERGAAYGLRWLNSVLRRRGAGTFCAGSDLTYFQYASLEAPRAHRRDVRLTRGTSVTAKRSRACSTLWRVTFTLTAGDPYEYGDPALVLSGLGGPSPETGGAASGTVTGLLETSCPSFDYTPVYDPLYPALVASPVAPNLYPEGWDISVGDVFTRYWVRPAPLSPRLLESVPMISLFSSAEARRVRVSVWPGSASTSVQCDPLFSAVINYLPAGATLYVDGEQEAIYTWDGLSAVVRRADSLAFSPGAGPVEWTSFTDPDDLLVTLDVFELTPGVLEGGGNIRMTMSLIPKSD